MKSCESYEIQLSSLLDGEAAPDVAAEAVEHALGCADCATFFRAARRLDAAARVAAERPLPESRAEAIWSAIGERAGRGESPAGAGLLDTWTRGVRAAALVVLGLGGGYLVATLGSADARLAETPRLAVATGSPGDRAMDERRFVALASELLASDLRYQRAMVEVLHLVPALASGEDLGRGDESRPIVRATNRDDAPPTGLL